MPWLGTFHSIGVQDPAPPCRTIGDGGVAPRPASPSLDTDDQIRLMRQLIPGRNLDEKRWPARQLAHLIDGWKNRCLTPARLQRARSAAPDGWGDRLYAYQRRLLELNAVPISATSLMHCVTLFSGASGVAETMAGWFHYILVDEYRDTNTAIPCGCGCWRRRIIAISAAWAMTTSRSMAGAAPGRQHPRFETDFPGARKRSGWNRTPLDPAYPCRRLGADRGEQGASGQPLWTEAEEGRTGARLIGHWDNEAEARWIGEEIEGVSGRSPPQRPAAAT